MVTHVLHVLVPEIIFSVKDIIKMICEVNV